MTASFSQNAEDTFINNYFRDFKGTLLEIGANQGTMLSNSRLMILNNWKAHLVEPASVFHELQGLYKDDENVQCYNVAIGDKHGIVTLYESGAHVPRGTDRALVSSLSKAETERWTIAGVKFVEKQVEVIPFNTFWQLTEFAKFDFISIDVEGLEWLILQQMDLDALGCKCLIIEWNGNENRLKQFTDYCEHFKMQLVVKNSENLIFTK